MMLDMLMQAKIDHLSIKDNEVLAGVQNDFVPLLAHWLTEWFKENGGINYVEASLASDELGPMTMHVQRNYGKTPHMLRKEAEAQAERYYHALEQIAAHPEQAQQIARSLINEAVQTDTNEQH
jgi:hypothetical protein